MARSNEWNESLYGCTDDCEICLCGWCCTPCLFGRNAKKIDGSSSFLWCCAYLCLAECYLCWIPHYFKRQILRENYGISEDPSCPDLLATICCSPCALCQEARFLKRRGDQPHVMTAITPQTTEPSRTYNG